MQLNSVVLPEPLGPIRPQISPRPTSNDTPSSATTPPNRTATSRMDNSGSRPVLPQAATRSLACFPDAAAPILGEFPGGRKPGITAARPNEPETSAPAVLF